MYLLITKNRISMQSTSFFLLTIDNAIQAHYSFHLTSIPKMKLLFCNVLNAFSFLQHFFAFFGHFGQFNTYILYFTPTICA